MFLVGNGFVIFGFVFWFGSLGVGLCLGFDSVYGLFKFGFGFMGSLDFVSGFELEDVMIVFGSWLDCD